MSVRCTLNENLDLKPLQILRCAAPREFNKIPVYLSLPTYKLYSILILEISHSHFEQIKNLQLEVKQTII